MIAQLGSADAAKASTAVDYFVGQKEAAVEPLFDVLQDGTDAAKINAVQALGMIRDDRAVEPLVALLENGSPPVCEAVIEALSGFNDAKAVKALTELLNGLDGLQRQQAASALARMGAYAAKYLLYSLKTGDETYRQTANDIFAQMGAEAVGPLVQAFIADPESPICQLEEEAVKRLEGNASAQDLIVRLRDTDSGVRYMALWEVPTALNENIAAKEQWKAMQAGMTDEQKQTAETPISIDLYLSDNSVSAWYKSAMDVLKNMGANAVDPLLSLTQDADSGVRKIALTGLCLLSDLKDARIDEAVLSADGALIDKEPFLFALGNVGDPRAVDLLIDELGNEADYIHDLAAQSLAKHSDDPYMIDALNKAAAQVGPDNQVTADAIEKVVRTMIDAVPPEELARFAQTDDLPAGSKVKLNGKVIVIDKPEIKLSRFFFQIPPQSRAKLDNLADVQAVVKVEWGEKQVGTYTCGTVACVTTCDVTVVDLEKNQTLGVKKFSGGHPPDTITYYDSPPAKASGSPPDEKEIIKYINSFFG